VPRIQSWLLSLLGVQLAAKLCSVFLRQLEISSILLGINRKIKFAIESTLKFALLVPMKLISGLSGFLYGGIS
jgi:hypothetical protein